jgi:hypothetical protein
MRWYGTPLQSGLDLAGFAVLLVAGLPRPSGAILATHPDVFG